MIRVRMKTIEAAVAPKSTKRVPRMKMRAGVYVCMCQRFCATCDQNGRILAVIVPVPKASQGKPRFLVFTVVCRKWPSTTGTTTTAVAASIKAAASNGRQRQTQKEEHLTLYCKLLFARVQFAPMAY